MFEPDGETKNVPAMATGFQNASNALIRSSKGLVAFIDFWMSVLRTDCFALLRIVKRLRWELDYALLALHAKRRSDSQIPGTRWLAILHSVRAIPTPPAEFHGDS